MPDKELQAIIADIQQGQGEQREELIKRYLPFILKVASQTCKRFVRIGQDEEVSIALIAFNEALDKYDYTQGTSFFAFSEHVIKRRIIDYFRKKQRQSKEISWSDLVDETGEDEFQYQMDRLSWDQAKIKMFEKESDEIRRLEILEFKEALARYGITLQELAAVSPKHRDAREAALRVAQQIYINKELRAYLEKTKTLPLKELEREARVSRKTMERQRKYIIALTLVLSGEFYYMQEYLRGIRG